MDVVFFLFCLFVFFFNLSPLCIEKYFLRCLSNIECVFSYCYPGVLSGCFYFSLLWLLFIRILLLCDLKIYTFSRSVCVCICTSIWTSWIVPSPLLLSSLCLCTYRSPLSSSHRTTTTTIITSLFCVNMCVWVLLCVNANVKADVPWVWKLLLSCFEKNVICVKVSFLTAIFFSSVSVCFALLVCVCVCEKSATSRKYLVSLRYQKSPLPNSSPGNFHPDSGIRASVVAS